MNLGEGNETGKGRVETEGMEEVKPGEKGETG